MSCDEPIKTEPVRARVRLLGGRLAGGLFHFDQRALFDLCHFRAEAVTLIVVALIRRAEATCAILHS
jgi:hypothetical protein